MASASERESALQAVVGAARAQVGELRSRVEAMKAAAHTAYVAGDSAGGDAAQEIADGAVRDLAAAEARLATLLGAEQVVSRERQADEYRAQLGEAEARREAALDERDRQAALITPAVQACKAAIRAARAAELAAKRADGEAHGLRRAIAGQPAEPYRSNLGRVDALIGPSRLLMLIESSNEF